MKVLDADGDGALSAEEIANASIALLTLDQDGDGALSTEELRPPRPPRGQGFVDRVMSFDDDDDGQVTADEMPQRMQRLLERADTNDDGAIDQAEAEAASLQKGRRPHRGRGGHGQRGQGCGNRQPES
jgi:Ca2+-binding EF-hand superfamily protein